MGAVKRTVMYEHALACLDRPETLSVASRFLQVLQFKGSTTWGQTETRMVTARALTAAEDWLELNRPKDPMRARIKTLRRSIEDLCNV